MDANANKKNNAAIARASIFTSFVLALMSGQLDYAHALPSMTSLATRILRLSLGLLLLVGFAASAEATTVSLSAPANGAVFVAGSNITVSATATPSAGQTITKVDFYRGTTLIATDTTSHPIALPGQQSRWAVTA